MQDDAGTGIAYWIYTSRAAVGPLTADSGLIYLQSRHRNAELGLTGYLHREDDTFAQYVEGPPEALEAVKRSIRRDGRHRAIRDLETGRTETRRFAGWDMAFTELERHLYRHHGRARGGGTDIAEASAEDIIAFMEDTIRDGGAKSVATQLPGQDTA